MPSSLINTTAPPTGQNSLTCTRFSLRGSETPLKSNPPYPPPTFFRSGLRPNRREKKQKKTQSHCTVLSLRCKAIWDLTSLALATHTSPTALFPLLATTLHLFEATAKHKKHLPRPDHDKSSFPFLLFSNLAITTKKAYSPALALHILLTFYNQ